MTDYKALFSQYLAEINRLTDHSNDKFGYTYTKGKGCQIYTCRRDDGRLFGPVMNYNSAVEMLSGFQSIIFALKLYRQSETFLRS
jgi:hypothetical protein